MTPAMPQRPTSTPPASPSGLPSPDGTDGGTGRPRTVWQTVALLLGIVLPLCVLVPAVQLLYAPADLDTHASRLSSDLADSDPVVVVLGSSLANRGVSEMVLATELGLRSEQVVVLQLPHASVAHHYAVLKNRVFAEGHRPKLVVVAGALNAMLHHELLTFQPNLDRLVDQLGPEEPVLGERVFGTTSELQMQRMVLRERAGAWREQLLHRIRDRVLVWATGKKQVEVDRLTDKVNESVFDDAAMDYSQQLSVANQGGSTGVGGLRSRMNAIELPLFELRDHGLLGPMQELADAYGAELAWVRMPLPPSNQAMDAVPEALEEDALAWMAEVGSGYLDLRSLPLGELDFEDMRHLSPAGAKVFTRALGRSLVAMGALGKDPKLTVVRGAPAPDAFSIAGEPVVPPLVPSGTCRWTGPAWVADALFDPRPPLEVVVGDDVLTQRSNASEDPCLAGWWRAADGQLQVAGPASPRLVVRQVTREVSEGQWLLPGQAVQASWDDGWRLPAKAFAASVRLRRLGPEPAEGLTWSVAGASFAMDADPLVPTQLRAEVQPEAPGASWSVELGVPADGDCAVWVQHLAVGLAPATRALVGSALTAQPATVRVIGGRREDTKVRVTVDGTLPDELTPAMRPGPKGLGLFVLNRFAELADAPDTNAAKPSQCSPLVVSEDGVPMERPHAACYDAQEQKGGRSCHAGNALYFSATDNSSPNKNGRTYAVGLDPSRSCETRLQFGAAMQRDLLWLYPGDTAVAEVRDDRSAALVDGARVLTLELTPMVADPTTPLTVAVLLDGQVWFETDVPAEARLPLAVNLPLTTPVPANPSRLAVRLSNPDPEAFYLVSAVTLSEAVGSKQKERLMGAAGEEAVASRGDPDAPIVPWAGVTRVGTPPVVPPLKKIASAGGGVWEGRLFNLWPVSDTVLAKHGLPAVTPLQLTETTDKGESAPYVHHADRKSFRSRCTGCFMHLGNNLVFRTIAGGSTVPDAALRSDVGFEEDGRAAWWVYPKTSLQGSIQWENNLEDEAQAVVWVDVYGASAEKGWRGEGLSLVSGERSVGFEAVGDSPLMRAQMSWRAPPGAAMPLHLQSDREGVFALWLQGGVQVDGVPHVTVVPAH